VYAITGATGHLGRLVVAELLKIVPDAEIVALARDVAKASDLEAKGILIREANYNRPKTLKSALAGIDRMLLISGNEIGRRVPQHKAVIDAAKEAGVRFIVYTSVLHADTSPLGVAEEHRQTEVLIKASGVPYVLLRNGWYTENYTAGIPVALERGEILGSSGDGRIASATRADYAAAASAALSAPDTERSRTYELAGDEAFTLSEFAAELSLQCGKMIIYRDLSESDYKAALVSVGLPDAMATLLARSSVVTKQGALFDNGRQLSRLIGRPTTPLRDALAVALKR
jgi:NAD(P)H dehydrogenase (quinone)